MRDLTEQERMRFVAATRAKVRPEKRKAMPTMRAPSAEPCGYCGIPGRSGCDHYLPFESRELSDVERRRALNGPSHHSRKAGG